MLVDVVEVVVLVVLVSIVEVVVEVEELEVVADDEVALVLVVVILELLPLTLVLVTLVRFTRAFAVVVESSPDCTAVTCTTGVSTGTFPWLMCIEFGVISTVRSVVPSAFIVQLIGIISLPLATILSCAEVPSVKNARAPLMSNVIPVMLPAGALVAPSRTLLFTRLVKLTFIPVFDDTL